VDLAAHAELPLREPRRARRVQEFPRQRRCHRSRSSRAGADAIDATPIETEADLDAAWWSLLALFVSARNPRRYSSAGKESVRCAARGKRWGHGAEAPGG
jgi:hypothetical protein